MKAYTEKNKHIVKKFKYSYVFPCLVTTILLLIKPLCIDSEFRHTMVKFWNTHSYLARQKHKDSIDLLVDWN